MGLGKVLQSAYEPALGIILAIAMAAGMLPATAVAESVGGVAL